MLDSTLQKNHINSVKLSDSSIEYVRLIEIAFISKEKSKEIKKAQSRATQVNKMLLMSKCLIVIHNLIASDNKYVLMLLSSLDK